MSDALQIANSIPDVAARLKALTTVARIAVRNGDRENGELALRDALELGEDMTNYDEHAKGAARVATVMADLHRYQDAREKAESCHLLTERVAAYTAILANHLQTRRPELTAPLAQVLSFDI